jgi:hypothetical protein
MDHNDIDFLDLGDGEFILRCEVGKVLQGKYDIARKLYLRDRGAGALRELQSIQGMIRRSRPDDIIKSDGLPELCKSVSGRTQIVCNYEGDPAADILRHAAMASNVLHHGGRGLGKSVGAADAHLRERYDRPPLRKSLADRIASFFGVPIDMGSMPERVRALYQRAIHLDEMRMSPGGHLAEQKTVADQAFAELVGAIAISVEANDALAASPLGARLRAAADIYSPPAYPQDSDAGRAPTPPYPRGQVGQRGQPELGQRGQGGHSY